MGILANEQVLEFDEVTTCDDCIKKVELDDFGEPCSVSLSTAYQENMALNVTPII